MESSTYVLNNFLDLCGEIEKPLRQTQRITYTCFDASTNYIVLGATSGSIYIFQRIPCTFLQLIQNMYGPISHVAISPQEKFIAFSTVKGTICVYVVKLSASYPQIVTSHYEDSTVLCLHWKRNEEQLFYGDAKGNVYLVNLTSFLGRNLTHISIYPILFLEAPIVQIADFNQMLLVSNYEKCILGNMETEEFKQIGNKPRNGYYGACFISSNANESTETKIICARPGSRLWTVDMDGNVLQTSQFKASLTVPPIHIFNRNALKFDVSQNQTVDKILPILQLPKLQPLFGRFVFGFTKDGFYIFDPSRSDIVLWNDQFRDIQNVKVVNKNCLIIFTNTNKLFQLNVNSLEEIFVQLLESKEYTNCITLLRNHREYFKVHLSSPLYVLYLVKLRQYFHTNGNTDLCDELEEIFNDLSLNDTADHANKEQTNFEPSIVFQNNEKHRNFEDNIKSVILSTISEKFTKSVLNKLSFFTETENEQNANGNNRSNVIVNRMPVRVNNDIVAGNRYDLDDDEYLDEEEDIVPGRNRIIDPPSILVNFREITAEEKLLQNLYMIYKSSQISNIQLVERYAYIFDQYDCAGIATLLSKLELIMIENGETDDEAKRHCLELYFNYLNPDLIWELDDESRQFIINGFVMVNTYENNDTLCANCQFPILIRNSLLKHVELGQTIFKYLWSRQKQRKCMEIVTKVPQTLPILCRFYIQEDDYDVDKLILHLFVCDQQQLFEEVALKNPLNHVLWTKVLDTMVSLHKNHQILCSNCGTLNLLQEFGTNLYSWTNIVDSLVRHVKGEMALQYVIRYANSIACDELKHEFFFKCLLEP